MNDVSAPKLIGDLLNGGDLFQTDTLGETLRLKCRYLYVHSRIQAKQSRGEEVSEELMETVSNLEETLRDRGIRPSSLLEV